MVRLFNAELPLHNTDEPTKNLLTAIAGFQETLDEVHHINRQQIMQSFNRDHTMSERRIAWSQCCLSDVQYDQLVYHVHNVAAALSDRVDYTKRFPMSIFNNTIADILIQSIYDNHVFTGDPLVRRLLDQWEAEVIMPLFTHLIATNNLAVLNNEPLIGSNACMEKWAVFSGDPKRGMFQTVGSALAKGFFYALKIVIDRNDPSLHIPSSFLGNLVGWGLHATDPTHRRAIMDLMSALLNNDQYSPSAGVYETIAKYSLGQIKRAKLDLIRDKQIGVTPDFRDEYPPADITWQNDLLAAARVVLGQKVPLGQNVADSTTIN
jgi:hypothetical protein